MSLPWCFIGNLKAKIRHLELKLDELSVQETEDAESAWMREIQRSVLGSHKFKEMQHSLGLFFDKAGVLCCGGQLKFAPLDFVTRHPILLPQRNYLSELIIRDCHEDVMNNGLKETLTQSRSRYWIPKGRQTVRRVIYRCVICRSLRAEGKAYAAPPPPDLPEFRVQQDFAFTNRGVDFAGPLYVRPMFEKDGEMHKVYIALFTCASSRAIHLDLVPSLEVSPFIRCLKRFFSHRDVGKLFISDNAKTFRSQDLKKFLLKEYVKWEFILPKSPWWGGFFERLVRCTKGCLKILSSARLTYEELLTLLVETSTQDHLHMFTLKKMMSRNLLLHHTFC